MESAGDDPLVPLVLLAHVEEQRRIIGLEQARALGGVDLLDLALGLVQELPVGRHCFRKDSEYAAGLWKGRGLRSTPMRRRYLITAAVALAAAGIDRRADARDEDDPAEAAQAGGTAAAGARLRRADRRGSGRLAPRGRSLRRRQGATRRRRSSARYRSLEAEVGSSLADWPHGFGDLAVAGARRPRAARSFNSRTDSRSTGAATGRAPKRRGARRGGRSRTRPTRCGRRTCSTRTSRAGCRTSSRASSRRRASRGSPRRSSSSICASTRPTCAGSSCTASRWSAWAGSSRRSASSRRPPGSLPTTRSRRSRVAVGRFDKADPSRTFSRLGPLAKRYPAEPERPLSPRVCPCSGWAAEEGKGGAAARPRRRFLDPAGDRGAPLPGAPPGRRDRLRLRWAERPMASVRRVCNSAAFLTGHPRLTAHRPTASFPALTGGVQG